MQSVEGAEEDQVEIVDNTKELATFSTSSSSGRVAVECSETSTDPRGQPSKGPLVFVGSWRSGTVPMQRLDVWQVIFEIVAVC